MSLDVGWLLEKKRKIIVIVLALVIILLGPQLLNLLLVPGPEGVRAVNYGLQFGSRGDVKLASQLNSLPENFEWGSTQPSVMSLKHIEVDRPELHEPSGGFFVNGPGWWYDHGSGEVRSEVQRPMLRDDPIGLPPQTLTYYKYVQLDNETVEIRKIVVEIVPADFVLQPSILPTGVYTFEDIRLWYALDTVVWMNAYAKSPPPDPDPPTNDTVKYLSSNYRGAFPIIGWIEEYEDWTWKDNQGNERHLAPDSHATKFVQLDPSLEGRFIDLYTTPDKTYDLMFSADVAKNPSLLQKALEPTWLPDPRFSETVFFYINMIKFGAYVKPTGIGGTYSSYKIWYPSVFYRLRVVYAVYGEYVYLWTTETAEEVGYEEEDWEVREPTEEEYVDPITGFFRAVGKWLSSPWTWLGLGTFGLLAVGIIVFVILLYFLGPGPLRKWFRKGED